MDFPSPLETGYLVKRYKRFLADIALDSGDTVTAHCPNPGSMMGVVQEGARAYVSRSPNKARKLPLTLELLEIDGGLLAVNTQNPNKIAAEAIDAGRIKELVGYDNLSRERPYGEGSRIDILLEAPERAPAYVEIKNVHLRRQGALAEFPDSVTTRGAKHLQELMGVAAHGARAVMLFIVQRMDCDRFAPAADLDPVYAKTLKEAASAGVELLCYDCEITPTAVTLRRPLPISLA